MKNIIIEIQLQGKKIQPKKISLKKNKLQNIGQTNLLGPTAKQPNQALFPSLLGKLTLNKQFHPRDSQLPTIQDYTVTLTSVKISQLTTVLTRTKVLDNLQTSLKQSGKEEYEDPVSE